MSADTSAVGPFYVVEVTIDDPARDIDALQDAGLTVTSRDGNLVTVYVDDAGLAQLAASGFPYEVVEQQPKPRPKSGDVPALGPSALNLAGNPSHSARLYADRLSLSAIHNRSLMLLGLSGSRGCDTI